MNAARKLPEPWHKADVKAAMEKAGYSFKDLDRELRLNNTRDVLRCRWYRIEQRVAQIIGVKPEEIWPDRYFDEDLHPLRRITRTRIPRDAGARNG